jgi:ABC-type antimicrobial peptide transport system permease subunit
MEGVVLTRKIVVLFITILMFPLLLSQINGSSEVSSSLLTQDNLNENGDLTFDQIIKLVNLTAIDQHVQFFSSLNSRVTGYPGCNIAADYIEEYFREYLSDVHVDYFNVTVPVDYGAKVILPDNSEVKAYPVYPNSVNTSPTSLEGVEGSLVYVGCGNDVDFNGKNVNGNIVLMDFNSLDNWLRAVSLGAKAVIFIEPTMTTTEQAEQKYMSNIPLNFPRVYVKTEDIEPLLSLLTNNPEAKVHLVSRIKYENLLGKNIIGFKYGSDLRNETILVNAYYDSISVVPSLADGANEAIGISSLLELVKFFDANPPKQTIAFVAFSGHGQNLAGARDFIMKLSAAYEQSSGTTLYSEAYANPDESIRWIAETLKIAVGIDLTTEINSLGLFYRTHFYDKDWRGMSMDTVLSNMQSFFILDTLQKLNTVWENEYGRTFTVEGNLSFLMTYGTYATVPGDVYLPGPFIHETDVFSVNTIPNVVMHTCYASFHNWNTPLDRYSEFAANIENLRPQLEYIFCSLYSLSLDPILREEQTTFKNGMQLGALVGEIAEYDVNTGGYSPVSNALVYVNFVGLLQYRSWAIVLTDEKGVFVVPGIKALSPASVEAYVVDDEGNVIYATDKGMYGAGTFPISETMPSVQLGTLDHPRQFVVFECGSLILYDCVGPQHLSNVQQVGSAVIASGQSSVSEERQIQVKVYDSHGDVEPHHYGYCIEDRVAMIFAQEGTSVKVSFFDKDNFLGLILNASETNPKGVGFKVSTGSLLGITLLQSAEDLFWLNEERLNITRQYNLYTGSEVFHSNAKKALENAINAMDAKNYSQAISASLEAWGLEKKAYGMTKGILQDVAYTTVSYFVMLLPFAFIFERILFSYRSPRNRVAIMVAAFGVLATILYFFHPGLHIAYSVYFILIGFVIVVLISPIYFFLGNILRDAANRLKKMTHGEFIEQMSTANFMGAVFSYSILQMKKRRLRTILTFFSLVIIVVSLIVFTTIVPSPGARATTLSVVPPYTGMYMRDYTYKSLAPEFIQCINDKTFGKGIFAPRVWWYPKDLGTGEPMYSEDLSKRYYISGILGVESSDLEIFTILKKGRQFLEGDYLSCIISDQMASALGIDVGDTVICLGNPLEVVGIFDSGQAASKNEMDGWGIMPYSPQKGEAGRLPAGSVLIIPLDLSINMGGQYYTISFFFDEETSQGMSNIAIDITNTFNIVIYSGEESISQTEFYSYLGSVSVSGFQFVILPYLIGVLIVLNTMIANVYERKRDMATLSTLGLNPTQISMTFLVEAIVYGFMSSVIAYAIGVVSINLMSAFGLIPKDFPLNYTSTYVFLVLISSPLITVTSTLYPLLKASKLVTPSLSRKWKITTETTGDLWEIPIPLVTEDEKDAQGLLMFMKDFLEKNISSEIVGDFMLRRQVTRENVSLNGMPAKIFSSSAQIKPFPKGIHIDVQLIMRLAEDNKWHLNISVTRTSGELSNWKKAVPMFVDILRKRAFEWRVIDPKTRQDYINRSDK